MRVEVIYLADMTFAEIEDRINRIIKRLERKHDADIVDIKYTNDMAFIHYKSH